MTREFLLAQMEAALEEGGDVMTVADLVELAKQKRVQIWEAGDAIIATELMRYPRRSMLNAFLAAGNLQSILQLEPKLEHFARANNAGAMIVHGRPGWGRVGRKTGWHAQSICYVKRVTKLNGGGYD